MEWVCINCGAINGEDDHACRECGAEKGTTHTEPASTVAMEPDEVTEDPDVPLGQFGSGDPETLPDEAPLEEDER